MDGAFFERGRRENRPNEFNDARSGGIVPRKVSCHFSSPGRAIFLRTPRQTKPMAQGHRSRGTSPQRRFPNERNRWQKQRNVICEPATALGERLRDFRRDSRGWLRLRLASPLNRAA